MKAAKRDSVLIEQVVDLASKAREATGQEPIYDIPKGISTGDECPIALALNLRCNVNGTSITFHSPDEAVKVAVACGLAVGQLNNNTVVLPRDHPFSRFVFRFDHPVKTEDKRIKALKL